MNSIGQLLLNGLVAGCGYGLMAVSFWLIYRLTHFFHFSHGAIFAVGAFIAFTFSFELNPVIASGMAVVSCGLLGTLLELLIYRPLRRRNSSPVVLLIVSIGVLVIVQNILSMIFGDRLRLLLPPSRTAAVGFEGIYATPAQLLIAAFSIAVSILLWLTLRFTTIGRVLQAVDCDEELATIAGINVPALTLCVFFVGSAIAGATGVLTAIDVGLRPAMGFNALLMGIVAMIVGNSGGVLGCLTSGLAIGLTQQTSSLVIDNKWQDAIVFALLAIFLLARPKGIAWAAKYQR